MSAIFNITDGTTTINLLAGASTGFHLAAWRPAIAQLKGGGTYQDSDIAYGRNLAFAVFATANETLNLKINDHDQDGLIQQTQDLLRLLQSARNYEINRFANKPVYIVARSACETNTRYARIVNYTINELDNPYAAPFFTAQQIVSMDQITLGLEREHWRDVIPGQNGNCVDLDTTIEWGYDNEWEVLQTIGSVTGLRVMFKAASGTLLMAASGASGFIYRSTDDGDTWTLEDTHTLSGGITAFAEDDSANLYAIRASSGTILKSTDDGDTWANSGTVTGGGGRSLLGLANGNLLAGVADTYPSIYQSTNNGTSWSLLFEFVDGGVNDIHSLLEASNSWLFAGSGAGSGDRLEKVYRSKDSGTTWEAVLVLGDGIGDGFTQIIQISSGRIIALNLEPALYASDDNGDTWKVILRDDFGVGYVRQGIIQHSNGNLYLRGAVAATETQMVVSTDGGDTWIAEGEAFGESSAGEFVGIVEADDGKLIIDDFQSPYEVHGNSFATATLGTDNTCTNSLKSFITNGQRITNITHIKTYDDSATTYADIFPMTSLPTELLPNPAGQDDILYIGISIANYWPGQFCSIVFNLSEVIDSVVASGRTLEYYNGAWTALSTVTLADGILGMSNPGINAVTFEQPSDWTTVSIDSVTAYWIRFRVSSASGAFTQVPEQQTNSIYAVTTPYVEINKDDIGGDIPAIARIQVTNEGDQDVAEPDLVINRVICGLRSTARGNNFQAYLNCSDEQQPTGVNVSVGTNTTFGDDVTTPTSRRATYNPTGVETMLTRLTFEFLPGVSSDYYGTFRAFLRCQRTGGSASDFEVRLQIVNGSGGILKNTNSVQVQGTDDWELLDFGQIVIPAGNLQLAELGDTSEIRIQASAANAAIDLYLYDLILIPVDEWSCDAIDKTNSSDSVLRKNINTYQKRLLDIDGLINPRDTNRVILKEVSTSYAISIWELISISGPVLQNNLTQRLWFLMAKTSATGTSFNWLSLPEATCSVEVNAVQQYLGLRGID